MSSGAYEREQYRRTTPLRKYYISTEEWPKDQTYKWFNINFVRLVNKETQKRHLACMMAYGKDMPETPHGPRILHGTRKDPQTPENVDPLSDRKLSRLHSR